MCECNALRARGTETEQLNRERHVHVCVCVRGPIRSTFTRRRRFLGKTARTTTMFRSSEHPAEIAAFCRCKKTATEQYGLLHDASTTSRWAPSSMCPWPPLRTVDDPCRLIFVQHTADSLSQSLYSWPRPPARTLGQQTSTTTTTTQAADASQWSSGAHGMQQQQQQQKAVPAM